MVKLIIEDDEGKTTVVPLIRDEITIGRKEGNTIRLTERNVSRRHARLLKQNGAIFIEDLNSYNGIKVNGNRIAGRVAIAEGDRVQIGDYVLGLKLEGAVTANAPTPPVEDVGPDQQTRELRRDSAGAHLELADARTMDLEPERTEPLTGAAVAAARPQAETYGRVVCVSTNFPGQEWLLDKHLMVIGRTEDNDIVINHRSISRHHARIVEEHGRYTIVDLQSSNGVRVNGEEYGKVELRRGDLIDLGHVRLRFVAPGEDFDFKRDGVLVDPGRDGSGRGALWGALAVVLVLGAAIGVWRFVLQPRPSGAGEDAHRTGASDAQQLTSTEADQAQEEELRTAMTAERWGDAVVACDKLQGQVKSRHEKDCSRASMEKSAQENYDRAIVAHRNGQYLEVIRYRKLIPEESIYRSKDKRIFEGAKAKVLEKADVDMNEALRTGACDKARAIAAEIKEVDPENGEADQRVASCGRAPTKQGNPDEEQHVRLRTPPQAKKVAVAKKTEPKAQTPSTADNQAEVSALMEQIEAAFARGEDQRVAELAKKVHRLDPKNVRAIQMMGASACKMKNQTTAKWAYDRLPSASRAVLKNVCRNYEINLE